MLLYALLALLVAYDGYRLGSLLVRLMLALWHASGPVAREELGV